MVQQFPEHPHALRLFCCLVMYLQIVLMPHAVAAKYMPPILQTLIPRGLLQPQSAARRRLNETDSLVDIAEVLTAQSGSISARRLQQPQSMFDHTGQGVMVVTAMNFFPCNAGIGNWVQLLTLRNKEDYARHHGYGLHWSLNQYGSRIKGPWNKVAALLYLAETLDENQYQWLLWVDYDAVFANMSTVMPLDKYHGHDLVLWATPEGMFDGDARQLNSGIILLRISSWSKLFLRELLKLGLDWRQGGAGQALLMEHVKSYEDGLYEQNGIVWLFKTRPEWRTKLYPERWETYIFHSLANHIPYQDGPNPKPVLTVHWAGCQLCSPMHIASDQDFRRCLTSFVQIWTAVNAEAVRTFHVGVPVDPTALLNLLEQSPPDQWINHRYLFD